MENMEIVKIVEIMKIKRIGEEDTYQGIQHPLVDSKASTAMKYYFAISCSCITSCDKYDAS